MNGEKLVAHQALYETQMMALKPDLQAQRDGCSMHKPAQRLHARSCLLYPGCNLPRHLSSCPLRRATLGTIRSFRTCRAANEALHNATPPTSIEIGAHSARSEHDAPSQSPLRPAHIAQSVDERRVPAQWRAIPQQVQRAAHSAPSPAQPSVRALPQGNRRAGNSRKKASISTKQQPYRPAAAKGDKPGGHKTSESSHRAVWPGPSHAHLQPYWAALEAGTLHGAHALITMQSLDVYQCPGLFPWTGLKVQALLVSKQWRQGT